MTRSAEKDPAIVKHFPSFVGPYALERLIGKGGMGEVYAAYDQRLERRVAVKHLRADKPLSPRSLERFRREAKAAASLSHQAIVQVFDILEGEDDGEWIVMEYVEGATLAERLRSGPMSIEEVVPMALTILDGLTYAHRRGILHRDLKTENIMVATDGRVKILDLGLAKRFEESESSLTAEGAVIGTLRAMSPEQAMGFKLDYRSDLFSLGILLYEMLTGDMPFKGDSAAATLARICTAQPQALHRFDARIPLKFSRLVDHLLAKDRVARPTGEEIRSELETIQQSLETRGQISNESDWNSMADAETIYGSPVPPAEAPPRILGRTRGRIAALSLGLLAITGGWLAVEKPQLQSRFGGHRATLISDHKANKQYREGLTLLSRLDIDGNLDQAIRLFEELVNKRPDMGTAHAGLARALWHRGRETKEKKWSHEALQYANRAVELEPFLAAGHVSLGLARIVVEPNLALDAFETALRLDPSAADAHRGMGRLYEEVLDDQEAALSAYRRAVEIRPENSVLREILGIFLWNQGNLDEAAEHFSKSIELAPDRVYAYMNLAGVYFMKDDYDAAATLLQQALEVRPLPTIYSNLGTIYFYQGRYLESIVPFKQATEVGQGARNPSNWSNLGDAYRWAPGYEEETRQAYGRSIELLREQLDAEMGRNTTLQSQMALTLARRGDWAEALALVAEIEERPDVGPMIELDLVMTYEQCGKRKQALETIERALAKGLPLEAVLRERELDRLRNDPGFELLITQEQAQPDSP